MTTVLLRSKKPGVRSSQTNSNNKYARYSVLEEPRSSRNRYGKYVHLDHGNVSKIDLMLVFITLLINVFVD